MKKKINIHLIAAARPNFMKIAPLYHALMKEKWANPIIVHTGQHYDLNMSDVFFQDLCLPAPDIHLGIGGGSHAEQTGQVIIAYEKILLREKPDLVIVVGDVNATLACTLAATKIRYPFSGSRIQNIDRPLIAHLEAGLRSFDRSMPEEINRIVTDTLADILWTPSVDGDENLTNEGVETQKIVRVGNIMLDSFEMLRKTIIEKKTFEEFGLKKNEYCVITLHRPSNVDHFETLRKLCETLISIAKVIPLCFPVHPRTLKQLHRYDLLKKLKSAEGILLKEPLNYVRFMNLILHCRIAITDSGGLQEETTYLGIPCLTIRPNTERPVTITQGTNKLCTNDNLKPMVEKILNNKVINFSIPELWDGKTANRIVDYIKGVMIK